MAAQPISLSGALPPGDTQSAEVPSKDASSSLDSGSIKQIDESKKSVDQELANKVADLSISEKAAPTNGEISNVEGAQEFKEYEESDSEDNATQFETEEQVRNLLSGVKREELLEFAIKMAMKDLGADELNQLAQAHEQQPDARKVHVRNLPPDLGEYDLKKAMNAFGKVESHVIIKNRYSQESRGFGFVTFSKKKYATRALDAGQVSINDASSPIAIQAVRPRRQFHRQQHQHHQFHHQHQYPQAAAGGGGGAAADGGYHQPQHNAHHQQQAAHAQYIVAPHVMPHFAGAGGHAAAAAMSVGQSYGGGGGGGGGYRGPRGNGGRGPRRAYHQQQQW